MPLDRLSGLTVRQHHREEVELEVEFVVADEHRQQVRFSPTSSALSPAVVRGAIVDFSPGGMGMRLQQFVPRMCEGSVRVFAPRPAGMEAQSGLAPDVVFEHRVKVRRVYLASHDPMYAVGVSFIDPAPDIEERVRVLRGIASHGAGPEEPPERGP